ncbi:hypothetical protein ABT115_15300 [Streptomyces sp. NPDC001832]|uniref:hypothetical protein n=1 Tax=Streptomyces sp. NPDC001832 TaxID=3154527 RepID=UPI00332D5A43
MSVRRMSAAAGVIRAAIGRGQQAPGIAMSLESAGLLQSPESAAELEQLRAQTKAVPYVLGESKLPEDLRKQLVALLAEVLRQGVSAAVLTGGMCAQGEMEAALSVALARYRYPAPGLFPSAAEQVHQLRARVAELEAVEAATYVAPAPSCTRCYGADAVRFVTTGGTTEPCRACGPSQVEQLRARVAELEAAQAAVLAPHTRYPDSPHCRADGDPWPCPTVSTLVPAPVSPWERAVAGLNALVDADVIFHVEPDGHISAPFSDEHIEWDLRARRWVLTHDDEDEGIAPDSTPDPLAYGPTGYRCGCGKDAHSNLTACQPMTADEWNARYPVGTPVLAYPDTREDEPLDTVTRTPAWTLGHGAAVVSVEGAGGGICLTHVDPIGGAS